MHNRRKLRGFLALLIFVGILFSPAASQTNPQGYPPEVLFERIDENLLRKFQQIENNEHPIIFGSSGGDAAIALKIADIIITKKININIAGLCLSACAEIILPVSVKYSNAKLLKLPLIGYHHNSEIYRITVSDSYVNSRTECYNKLNTDFLNFRKKMGLNYNSLLYQINAINPFIGNTSASENCKSSKIELGRSFWFPTSVQLREIYGIHISENVCADVPKCFEVAIPMLGEVGEIYLVGDKEYIIDRKISGKIELSFIKNVNLSIKDN